MSQFLEFTINGISIGAVYALIALGFVVIYRSSEIFNFAHGEFLTVGAFSMVSMASAGIPWPLAVLGAMLITGAVAATVERVVIRPMIGRPVFVTIILTIFVAYLLRAGVVIILGSETSGIPTPWDPLGTVEIGGTTIDYNEIAGIVAAIVALGAYFLLIKYTKLGIAVRATGNDQEVALALGIPVGRVFAATWFLAGMYAAVAGIFLALFLSTFDVNLGLHALRAFPAVIVGGLTSPLGTVIAAFLLGIAESLADAYLAPHLGSFGHDFYTVFSYVVMILVLMIRPYGLLGSKQVERV